MLITEKPIGEATAEDAFMALLARANAGDWDGKDDRPLSPDDIARVEWCQVQQGMIDEEAVRALVVTKDNRKLYVRGQCDTTGWGCIGNRWETRDATAGDEWQAKVFE